MSFQQYNVYDGLTACRVVAITNQTGTYFNGPLNNGVGATFTYATGVLTIDGVDVMQGDSVALVNQTNGWENGIYVCTVTGAVGVSAVLQRRGDMQCIEQLKMGQWTTIGAGTAGAGSMFVVIEPLPAIFGVNDLKLEAAFPAGSGTASTKAASDNTKPIVASVGSSTVATRFAKFVDVSGTIDDTAGNGVNLGDIIAGVSGTPGKFQSFPTTAANGSLLLSAVDSGAGNFNTTISNSLMGQSSVVSIPDPGAATANFLLSRLTGAGTQHVTSGSLQVDAGNVLAGLAAGGAGTFVSYPTTTGNGSFIWAATDAGGAFNTTISNGTMGQSTIYTIPDVVNAVGKFLVGAAAAPFVSGNFPVASGTGGLMVDSGVPAANLQNKTNIIAAQSANIGGAGAGPLNIVNASVVATSVIVASIISSSNPCSLVAVAPGAGSFNVTVSADPGASLLISYVIFVAPQ